MSSKNRRNRIAVVAGIIFCCAVLARAEATNVWTGGHSLDDRDYNTIGDNTSLNSNWIGVGAEDNDLGHYVFDRTHLVEPWRTRIRENRSGVTRLSLFFAMDEPVYNDPEFGGDGWVSGFTMMNNAFHLAGPVTVASGEHTIDNPMELTTDSIWDVAVDSSIRTTGSISGEHGLVQTGDGLLTLGTANTFTGGVTVNGGTVAFAQDDRFGHETGTVLLNGGTLSYTAAASHSSTREFAIGSDNGTIDVVEAAGTFAIAATGSLTGEGDLVKTGPGTFYLNTVDSRTGGNILVEGGTLEFSFASRIREGSVVTLRDGVTLENSLSSDGPLDITDRPIVLGGGTATLRNTGARAVSVGEISGAGALRVEASRAGSWVFAAPNHFTGGTVLGSGRLIAQAAQALGTGEVTVENGAELILAHSHAIDGDAELVLGATATLDLDFTGNQSVATLSLDGGITWLDAGTYSAGDLTELGYGTYRGTGHLVTGAKTGLEPQVLLRDAFSGTVGDPLVGRIPDDTGTEAWSNIRHDTGTAMDGTFLLAEGGGVRATGTDIRASAYLPFDASAHTDGWKLMSTVIPNDDVHDNRFFTIAMVDTVDKGILLNVDSGNVIRLNYFAGGSNAGRVRLNVFEDGQEISNTLADRSGFQTVSPTDEIELSITAYPLFGMIEGRAYNVTGGYELARTRVGVNTPNLTTMQFAGMGLAFLRGDDPEIPARVTSFSIETPPDFRAARMRTRPEQLPHPIRFPAFSFDEMVDGTNDVRFLDYLQKHETAVYIHSPRRSVWSAVRRALPDKILIEQDAYGGVGIFNEDLENIYPGHCLLREGTLLTADCTPGDTVLHLGDATRVASNQGYVDRIANLRSSYLLMYALDGEGNPDWDRAEHIRITAVDPSANTITVERGKLGSAALAFESGQAVVAAHVMYWRNQWHVNISLDSPRGGPFNMTGSEWYALRKLHRIWILDADGIEFDVGRWNWGQPESTNRGFMDVTNDRTADFGYVNGINSFGLGGDVFFRTLREFVGPHTIIQVDGNDAMNGPRSLKYLNGVQLESYPHANAFDRFSESFLHLRLWVERVEQPAFSYPFTKTPTSLFGDSYGPGGESNDWRFRTGFAAALLTGMPHPFASLTNINFDPENPDEEEDLDTEKGYYVWDENRGGHLDDYAWMRYPTGEAVQVLDQLGTSNLLAGTQWEWITENGFSASNSSADDEFSTEISGLPPNTPQWTSAFYPDTEVPRTLWFGNRLQAVEGTMPVLEPGKEYTLEFEARGNDSWEVYGQVFEQVPRALMIHGVADYGVHKQASVFLFSDWTFYRFTMIADEDAPPPLAFGFSEQVGDAAIRNIRLYEGGAERWVRDFDRGRVYLNMTLEPWTVHVGTGVVQRLQGDQIPELYDGAVVNGELTIPPWDAAILRTGTFDAWATKHFTPQEIDEGLAAEGSDADGDGMTNLEEYIAGTDPRDNTSYFAGGIAGVTTEQIAFDWFPAVSGRVYQVYWTPDLAEPFEPVSIQVGWPQSGHTLPIPEDEPKGFYRIGVERR